MPQDYSEDVQLHLSAITANKEHMSRVGNQLTEIIRKAEADLRNACVHVKTRVEHHDLPIALEWSKAGGKEWRLIAFVPLDDQSGQALVLNKAIPAVSCDIQSKAAAVQLIPRLVYELAEHTEKQRRAIEEMTPYLDHTEGE